MNSNSRVSPNLLVSKIPNYELYGEEPKPAWENVIHIELIQYRSSMHEFKITPHVHEGLFQVLHVRSGYGETFIDGVRWPLRPGSLVVVPATSVHGFIFSVDIDGPVVTAAQKPLESLVSVVAPELLSVIRTAAVIDTSLSPRHAEGLMPLFEAIERESLTHASGHIIAGTALLIAMFVQIARVGASSTLRCESKSDAVARSRKAMQVERFRALVDISFRERPSMGAYAAQLGVSAGQLTRICKEIVGMSCLDVLNARVVHEAQRELAYSLSSIKEIAAILGFTDEAYFGRLFRKHTGQTPTEFRQKALARLGSSRLAD
jgi:AraC family transcriptional activator of pobA